jgi:hypothetical protein
MFYNISGFTAIDFVYGKKSHLYAGPDLLTNNELLKFTIIPFHIEHNLSCKLLKTLPLVIDAPHQHFDVIVFKGKRIIYLKDRADDLVLVNKVKADILVIGKNSTRDLSMLLKNFHAEQIIIDGANSRWLATRLFQQSQELNLNCISLPDQGGRLFEL